MGKDIILRIALPHGAHPKYQVKAVRFDATMTVRQAKAHVFDLLGVQGLALADVEFYDAARSAWLPAENQLQKFFLPPFSVLTLHRAVKRIIILVEEQKEKVARDVSFSMPVADVLSCVLPTLTLKKGRVYGLFREGKNSAALPRPHSLAELGIGADSTIVLRDTTKQAGSIGTMFGAKLDHLVYPATTYPTPPVVQLCCAHISTKGGLQLEGIFRLSGNANEIQKYKAEFDKGSSSSYDTILAKCRDPHAVAGLLKLFLREMPEPLLTFERYNGFRAVPLITDAALQVMLLRHLIYSLPPPNFRLLRDLVAIMVDVTKHQDQNHMGHVNLATVLAPNILKESADEDQGTLIMDTAWRNAVCSLIITNFAGIFHDKAPFRVLSLSQALYAYAGQNEHQLSFDENDYIFIVNDENPDDPGWLTGYYANAPSAALQGPALIPNNYVTTLFDFSHLVVEEDRLPFSYGGGGGGGGGGSGGSGGGDDGNSNNTAHDGDDYYSHHQQQQQQGGGGGAGGDDAYMASMMATAAGDGNNNNNNNNDDDDDGGGGGRKKAAAAGGVSKEAFAADLSAVKGRFVEEELAFKMLLDNSSQQQTRVGQCADGVALVAENGAQLAADLRKCQADIAAVAATLPKVDAAAAAAAAANKPAASSLDLWRSSFGEHQNEVAALVGDADKLTAATEALLEQTSVGTFAMDTAAGEVKKLKNYLLQEVKSRVDLEERFNAYCEANPDAAAAAAAAAAAGEEEEE